MKLSRRVTPRISCGGVVCIECQSKNSQQGNLLWSPKWLYDLGIGETAQLASVELAQHAATCVGWNGKYRSTRLGYSEAFEKPWV